MRPMQPVTAAIIAAILIGWHALYIATGGAVAEWVRPASAPAAARAR